ncbi:MAG: metal-dependent hydrolase [Patescibacteria group bacterium]|nr:metal-dependent hydrolase [Patescibacteria group bacterium]
MTSRTHDLFAFASLVTVAAYYPPASLNLITAAACLVGNIIGSLIPDMDQATNRLWDLLPGGDYLGKFFKKLFLSHRTLSHSFIGFFLLYHLLSWLLPKLLNSNFINVSLVISAVMIGLVSHLLLDAFTEEGLPLFFPLTWKIGFPPLKEWRIKTGKWFEKFIVFPVIVIYLFLFFINNKGVIISILKLSKF